MSRVAYLQAFREQDALRAEADAASLGELQQRIADRSSLRNTELYFGRSGPAEQSQYPLR